MEFLKFEKRNSVGILTINRPQALNALNKALLLELKDFLGNGIVKENIRVLILTGAGEKAFIAGADIKEMLDLDHLGMLDFCQLGNEVTHLLESSKFVTLAAVNGYALGGGLEMALACDFIYASTKARFALPEVSLGLIPGFGGTQRLSRAIGARRAIEYVTTGKQMNAEEAQKLGLVNHISEEKDLLQDCLNTAEKILSNSFLAVLQARRAIHNGYNLTQTQAIELEKQMCSVAFATADRLEGMKAFTEKRKPNFS